LDANGEKLWDKSFGGDDGDLLLCLTPTRDGGFLLGGGSVSGVSGNKTTPSFNSDDAWIVRLDSNGNKLWDRTYGGIAEDAVIAVEEVPNGFVLGCFSQSFEAAPFDGDFGNGDYWIVRIDPDGNKVWDLPLGGSEREELASLVITGDGSVIAGGTSYSPTDHYKTSPYYGGYDYWIVKLQPDFLIADRDQDGIPNFLDTHNGPPENVGVTLDQLVQCDGPWRNHLAYVHAVAEASSTLFRKGVINSRTRIQFLTAALKSNCGKPPKPATSKR
jgi:hypothetical protein